MAGTSFEGFNPDAFRVHTSDVSIRQANNPTGRAGKAGPLWDTQIRAKKMEMLSLLVQGYTIKETAALVRIGYHTARQYARDPEFLHQLKSLSAETHEKTCREVIERKVEAHTRILEMSDRALDKLEELIESEDERISIKAVENVLDRHGDVPRASKSNIVQTTVKVDADLLRLAASTMQELEAPRKVARGMLKVDGDDRQ